MLQRTDDKNKTASIVPLKNVKSNNKTQPIHNETTKKNVTSSASSFTTETDDDDDENEKDNNNELNKLKKNANTNVNDESKKREEKKVFFKIVRGPFYIFSSFLLIFVTVMIFVAYFTNNWQTTRHTNLQYNQNQMLEYVKKIED